MCKKTIIQITSDKFLDVDSIEAVTYSKGELETQLILKGRPFNFVVPIDKNRFTQEEFLSYLETAGVKVIRFPLTKG